VILSDLLDSVVLADSGRRIGHVIDVRFIIDDDDDEPRIGTAQLDTLIVSPRSRTSFMGYERSNVTAPLFIARFLRGRHRGSCLIEWNEVGWIEPGTIRLRPGYTTKPLPDDGTT
jgi:sporulation protein YlmC with PRC-barrel domain